MFNIDRGMWPGVKLTAAEHVLNQLVGGGDGTFRVRRFAGCEGSSVLHATKLAASRRKPISLVAPASRPSTPRFMSPEVFSFVSERKGGSATPLTFLWCGTPSQAVGERLRTYLLVASVRSYKLILHGDRFQLLVLSASHQDD